MLGLALMACKHINVDFTYSPAAPRAGEPVYFANHSSSGEEWEWIFGSGATSTLKSPTYTYKQPGTYRVTLKVDKKSSRTATKEIIIYDTIPTFTCEETDFTIYTDYTFKAVVYNPYNYDVKYEWYLPTDPTEFIPPYCIITDTAMNMSTLHLYFTRPISEARIGLRVTLNGVLTDIEKRYDVSDRTTRSVLLRTEEGDYRQRIFGDRAEPAKKLAEPNALLNQEQDTTQRYNNYVFTIEDLSPIFPGIVGFHIASRKIYYRANGLWVAYLDGAHNVQIDSMACNAMTLDTKDNRIYWANEKGVWYMPFVGSENNKFITVPVPLNEMKNVTKIAADADPK